MITNPALVAGGLRLGLCCQLRGDRAAHFRSTTVRALTRLTPAEARRQLAELTHANGLALLAALAACQRLQIRAFRVTSGLLPLATHPDYRYDVDELDDETRALYEQAGAAAHAAGIRLSIHPDQFVLLGSPEESVTTASLRELELQGRLAELLGADAINLPPGGSYGDKRAALDRLVRKLGRLSPAVRQRLTLENDDRVYTVADLLPLCRAEGVPLTYDVHHHRCNPDGLDIEEASHLALATWDREAFFHISSPRDGWEAANPRGHADYIDVADFPTEWLALDVTVDVEAKAKEDAVLDLREKLTALHRAEQAGPAAAKRR